MEIGKFGATYLRNWFASALNLSRDFQGEGSETLFSAKLTAVKYVYFFKLFKTRLNIF